MTMFRAKSFCDVPLEISKSRWIQVNTGKEPSPTGDVSNPLVLKGEA